MSVADTWTFDTAMDAVEQYEFQMGVCVGANETQGPTYMKLSGKRDAAKDWLRDCCSIGAPLLAAALSKEDAQDAEE